jgi:peptidase M28-like protein
MTAASPASERRRPRPGSLERPVNGRLYRSVWAFVALPVLLLAFIVSQPPALQLAGLPPAFDGNAAAAIANDLAARYPNRLPGTPGARGAENWFTRQLAPFGFSVQRETFTATVHGHKTKLVNLVAEEIGISPHEIVVMAHRDDSGTGRGLDDNASGTGALIELARSYAPSRTAQVKSLPYSLAFVSTDGAEEGALGAAHFAADVSTRRNVVAVINLDSIGGKDSPRLEFGGDTARSPAPGLLETIQAALAKESSGAASRPGALDQLMSLAFPFSAYEQAPFTSNGIPAVTITTGRARPADASRTRHLELAPLTEIGLATQDAVDTMEEGIPFAQGPSSYLFLGRRVISGWEIEFVLIAMLLPFIAAAVDLFARCRRRRIPISPALRSYRSRLAFWALGGLAFLLFAAAGFLGATGGRPAPLNDVRWPIGALLVLGLLGVASWLVTRDRLIPRRPIRPEEELAGHTAALLALSVVGLLVAATNPYALVFLLPCLHFWLWLPQVQARPRAVRALVLLLGLAGPAYLVWTFAAHYGLGWDAPWYIAQLFAVGYAPRTLFVIALGWIAAAGQLVALASNRYAPYPSPGEAPRRGPIRDLIRTLVLAQRRRAALMERSGAARRRPRRP